MTKFTFEFRSYPLSKTLDILASDEAEAFRMASALPYGPPTIVAQQQIAGDPSTRPVRL